MLGFVLAVMVLLDQHRWMFLKGVRAAVIPCAPFCTRLAFDASGEALS